MHVHSYSKSLMELIGQRFGNIRVTSVVGQGGMGDVYSGYDEKLERKVAVKVLNEDQRLDGEARERLLREARALSRLDHPNICRIHDYIESSSVDVLILEYIDGKTLGDLLGEPMTRQEKIRIAAAIASVLVAAHRAGIVHRDLKPENVMLTNEREVKVLDFGLARWLQKARTISGSSGKHRAVSPPRLHLASPDTTITLPPDLHADSSATAAGITLGTPLYMSPEQARGETLTSASDMFSFGLLLQVLFTGNEPHPMGLSAREVILRVARGETNEVEGAPGDVTALINRLKQFAPADRPTAVEMVERLRHLMDRPQRIARRAAAAAFAAIVALSAWRYTVDLKRERAIAVSAQQEAVRRRAQAEELINFMVGDLRKKLEPVGRLEILDDVGKRAIEYVDSLNPATTGAAELALNAKALNQLGDVRIAQGKLGEALALFQRSLRLAQVAVQREPSSPAAQLTLATGHFWIGDVYRRQGKLPEALAHLAQYQLISERLANAHPGNDEYQLERAYGHSVVATIYERKGEFSRALEHLRLTREVKEARLRAKPDDPDRQADLALTMNRIGFVLDRSGNWSDAREHYEREFATYSRLTVLDPQNNSWKERLVNSHSYLARLYELTGDVDGALKQREAGLALAGELASRDPANAQWNRNLAVARFKYGDVLRMSGDLRGARAAISDGEQTLEQLLERKDPVSSWRRDLGITRTAAARLHLASGDPSAAERAATSAIELFEPLLTTDADMSRFIADSHLVLGDARAARGNATGARQAWTKSASLAGPLARAGNPEVMDIEVRSLIRLGRHEEAVPFIERLKRIGYRAPDFMSAIS